MTVTKGRPWWTGTTAADIDTYLAEFSEKQGDVVGEVVHARCSVCDADRFHLEVDDEEGFARRRCTARAPVVMLDAADVAEDACSPRRRPPLRWRASSRSRSASPAAQDRKVRWVYLGLRCVLDGVLGVYADWGIDYTPSRHLLARV